MVHLPNVQAQNQSRHSGEASFQDKQRKVGLITYQVAAEIF
jgi:hypothetical protein